LAADRQITDQATYKKFSVATAGDETVDMPSPRGGHSMTLIGNPPVYIMIYGGVTQETILQDDVKKGLKCLLGHILLY